MSATFVRNGLALCLWTASLMTQAAPKPAATDEIATQNALDALFSVPAVTPEGLEGAPVPPRGFDPETAGEDQLIAYLAEAKRQGADLNAYRNFGTPLLHAVRAGLEPTALWLLKNGANPLLKIGDTPADSPSADALGLAVDLGRWQVVNALRRHPTLQALPVGELDRRVWAAAMAHPVRLDEVRQHKLPLPRIGSSASGHALLMRALCGGSAGFALALLDADPTAHPAPPPTTPWQVCPAPAVAPTEGTAVAAPSTWAALEKRLGWPLLNYALRTARNDGEAHNLLAIPLKRPWGDATETRRVTDTVARSRLPALWQLLHSVPVTAMRQAAQADTLRWAEAAADAPGRELDWALAQVDPTQLSTRLAEVARLWDNSAGAGRSATADERDTRWAVLTTHLVAPLPGSPSPLFFYGVPHSVWPRWFALGFKVAPDDWAQWLLWSQPSELRQAWPLLAAAQPELARRSLTWMVAPLSTGPTDDEQAARLSFGASTTSGSTWNPVWLEKARFLHAQGLTVRPVRRLAAPYRLGLDTDPALQYAVQAQWVLPGPAVVKQKLQALAPRCKPVISPAMRRALASTVGDQRREAFQPTTLQWLDAPEGDACVWLVSNGESGGRREIVDEGFGNINVLRPCADNLRTTAIWQPTRSQWENLDGHTQGDVVQVRLPGTANGVGVLQLEMDFGMCGNQPAMALEWTRSQDGQGWMLKAASPGHALTEALLTNCDLRNTQDCLVLPDALRRPDEADAALSVALDQLLSGEKGAFLDAINRLDRPALATARSAGLFPHWVDEAVARVAASGSGVPLAEKRKRMAWLLAQHDQLTGLQGPTLNGLVDWLPPEDWGTILRSLRCNAAYLLDQVGDEAKKQSRPALEARVRAARGQPCPIR